ncbi:unnamed protein product [Nezara viridula]|uniref:Uncharacterized protein n=1 Tax=Nezara viridula TaxID=85310 RepID=A0A9P0MU76_NEZVI|nr:unnamed protein product [Nezara viridula]
MHSSSHDNGFHQRKIHQHKVSSVKQKYDKQYKKIKSINLLKEFTQNSTIHGVQHIFREGETPVHRLIWSVFFTICLTGAMYFIYDSWTGYVSVPIVMSVVETSYPLDAVYFPAVSVCPVQKIVLSKAMEYFTKNLDNATLNDVGLNSFLKALTALQYPLYRGLSLYLYESGGLLQKLEILNITELMLKSLPGCEEIFFKCYWRGFVRNCCSLFHLQRSEIGFCYSFNSFTSEKYKDCIYKDKEVELREHCILMTTSGTGPGSGVGVLFKSSNSSDQLLVNSNSKAMIQMHHPNEYPEPGMGTLIPIEMEKMNVLIKATVTESSDDIRKMHPAVSGCYFKDSKKSLITTIYSQKSCLFECRMSFLIKKCGCLPYYIVMEHFEKTCNATELLCIAAHKEELRFYRPPSASSEVTEDIRNSSLDCTHCLPTCNERHYEVVVIDFYTNTGLKKHKYDGFVDIYYKDTGVVKYQREMSYNFIQLVVNLGGIGGLFLGASLLSLLEVVFWLSKALIIYIWPMKEKKRRPKKQVPEKGTISHIQGWLD